MVGHRRTGALSARGLAVLGLIALVAACTSPPTAAEKYRKYRKYPPPATQPVVETVDARVHPQLAEFGAFEVAVQPPSGDGVPDDVLAAFRQAFYDGLLAKGYSPLALSYVDEAGADAVEPGLTSPLRARITEVLPAKDGGHLASGWVGIVSLGADGSEETLYVSEIRRLRIPPQMGPALPAGGPDTGRRLANGLLRHLPAR